MHARSDIFTDEDLWAAAADARADRPKDPMMDDAEAVRSLYHRKMAEFQCAHYDARQDAIANRQVYALVMINGKACDPELELRLAELEGLKEQTIANMKRICAIQLAGVLAYHLSRSVHVGI